MLKALKNDNDERKQSKSMYRVSSNILYDTLKKRAPTPLVA